MRIGEFTAQMEKASAGRPSKEMRAAAAPITKSATLEAAGIAKEDAKVKGERDQGKGGDRKSRVAGQPVIPTLSDAGIGKALAHEARR